MRGEFDLFNPKHPVDPEFFVNRREILEKFTKMVERSAKTRPPKPDNIAVVGEWGIGKTSMLKKFESLALTSGKLRAFTAFIELTPATCANFNSFIVRVRDEIERSFMVSDAPLLLRLKKKLIPEWRLKTISYGITLEFKERERSPVTVFEDSLRDLWKTLEKCNIDTALLLFDDMHYVAEKCPDILYDIRGIFQKLAMDGCNFSMAISGKESLFFMAKEFAEPFTRFFDRFKLEKFGYEDTKKAILKPMELSGCSIKTDEEAIQKIHNLTEGHPYFIHFIMQDLIDAGRNIDASALDAVYPNIAKHLAREKFDGDFGVAGESERRVLFALAACKENVVPISKINVRVSNPRRDIIRLVDKNLVIRSDRGEYSLYHPLFKNYLNEKSTKCTKCTKSNESNKSNKSTRTRQ
jgi:hypothetical protein